MVAEPQAVFVSLAKSLTVSWAGFGFQLVGAGFGLVIEAEVVLGVG